MNSQKANDCIIIIPAYNAEKTIKSLLKSTKKYSIIVVDDGSIDGTSKIVKSMNVPIVSHSKNKGVGEAITTGIEYGLSNGYSYAVTIDSDGQHSPLYIDSFIEKVCKTSFVIGNRFHDLKFVPSQKLASNLLGSKIFEKVYGRFLPDVSCGFRAFPLDRDFLKLGSKSYDFIFEQLVSAIKKGFEIEYVNIPVVYYMNELLSTRILELKGFLTVVNNSIKTDLSMRQTETNFNSLISKITCKEFFQLTIDSYIFYGFYLKDTDSYVIQTDIEKAYSFYKLISDEKNKIIN